MNEISRQQLLGVIADFLEMGHVDNIVAMFKQDPSCLDMAGELIQHERFMVRMGVAVLFEELVSVISSKILDAAVPSLVAAMEHEAAYIRGDAAYVLGTIRTPTAMAALVRFQSDPDPQVAEVIGEALAPGLLSRPQE